MKIAVWHSTHEISDTVCKAIKEGLPEADLIWAVPENYMTMMKKYDLHIGYGILRGVGEIFKRAESFGIPYIELDKGYFKPSHYDGYYRISLCGTQQTIGLDKLEPDYERWDALNVDILPSTKRVLLPLVCGPTQYVESFFNPMRHSWWERQRFSNIDLVGNYINRPKECERPLQDDLDKCSKVITFNSSVGWEALRQGIPVTSDPTHSIVGAYQKLVDKPLCSSYDERRKLFAIMASLQLTLSEIRNGLLWPLLQKLLSQYKSTSATIAAKP